MRWHLDELHREPGGAGRQRPELTQAAQLERAGHLAATIRSAEPRTARPQRRGDRVEILDAKGQMVDSLLVCAQARLAQLRLVDREDLERASALAQKRRRYPVLRQLDGPYEREAKRALGLRDRGVELANEISDVVKLSEQCRRA